MYDCKNCKAHSEEPKRKTPEAIPYIVHEFELAKAERRVHHLFAALAFTACAFIISNTAWICFFVTR